MLRLTLTNLISSRNSEEGYYSDEHESKICVRGKQIIWPEGDSGSETQIAKKVFPSIQEIALIKKKIYICIALC